MTTIAERPPAARNGNGRPAPAALPPPGPARQLTPVELFVAQVLPPEREAEMRRSLPEHVRPERFKRNFVNAVMQNPELLKCDPRLVYREIMRSAALGLVLDPQLGEGYVILRWNGRSQRLEPQFQTGYRGVMKLARQSGDVSVIYAHEVCEFDEIECSLGDEKKLVHRPNLFGERGRVVGYYAVVKYKDGATDFEPMTVDQVNAIRARSDGWKAFEAKKIKSTPWSTDYDAMALKTAIRRLLKRVPQSPDLADQLAAEDRADTGAPVMQDVTPQPRQVPEGGKLEALEQAISDGETVHVDTPGPDDDADAASDEAHADADQAEAEAALNGEILDADAEPDTQPIAMPMKGGKPDVSAYVKAINDEVNAAPAPEFVDRILAREERGGNFAKAGSVVNGIKMNAARRKQALAAENGGQ